jgi:hypothetical protein
VSEQLIELAERCEKATGPDRELDAEIACHAPICQADYVRSASPANRRGMVTRHFNGGGRGTFVCDSYTASLDAAMTLVPEGAELVTLVLINSAGRMPSAGIDGGEHISHAATPALALCAAALRARAK